MNVRWKVDLGETNFWQAKGPSEIDETSRLCHYRKNYYIARQRSICENYFFVGCGLATLYNLIAMRPIKGLAFMLSSRVCITE